MNIATVKLFDRELNIDYEYVVEKTKNNLSNYSNISAINNQQVMQIKIQINIAKVRDIKNISNYIKILHWNHGFSIC